MKILIKTLNEKKRGIIILGALLFGLSLYVMLIFPEMDQLMEGFDEMLDNPAFKVFAQSITSMSSIEGFLAIEVYQWGINFLLAGYAIFFAASFIAGEIEDKTIDVLLANPVSRTRILLEKYVALVIMVALVNIAVFAGVLAGAYYIGEDIDIAWVVYTHVLAMPFLLAMGSYSTLISAVLDDSRKAFSVGFGILIGSFIVDSVSLMSEKYADVGRFTLFYYFDAGKILVHHEINWNHTYILLAVAVVVLAIAVIWFRRRDISVT
ncbi:MAG: ABC transporter permease subunit [Candidatus Methanofastidiosia archaeon]|jgi:ABC-2 type transport system permease protein